VAILHDHIEGKYEILGKLREGGMGAIYKVRHRLLDEIRVVKVLHPHLTATKDLSDRFLREARFAVQLRHPNIAQLHDFSVADDGSAFIVMELIDGATLQELLAQAGPPALGLGLEIARQTLKALGFLHRRGLVHRDVSPDNLMLARDPDGEPLVKLIDVGIAKALEGAGELTSTGAFLGKPRYASPEQFGIMGALGVDARSDLYSFGIVLYELLTGIYPIQGRDPSSLMAGHLFRPPIDFADSDPDGRLPSDLRTILLRILAKSPDERFTTAEDLSRTLSVVQSRFPVQAGDLEAALLSARIPASEQPPPQGTTQDRLDRQFLQAPTPAWPAKPVVESTLVLRQPPVLPTDSNESAAAPWKEQPTPSARAPASSRTAAVASIVADRRPAPQQGKRGLRSPAVAAVLVVFSALIAAGHGFWSWSGAPPSAPENAAAPPEPPVTAARDSPPPEAPTTGAPEPAPTDQELTVREPAATPPPVSEPRPAPSAEPQPRADKAPERAPASRPIQQPSRPAPPPVRPQEDLPPPREQPPPAVATGAPAVTVRPSEQIPPEGDVPARLLSAPSPAFPQAARGTGVYARILVAVHITESGAVSETRIKTAYVEDAAASQDASSIPNAGVVAAFRAAAREAAREARFAPAQRNGVPVPTWGELTFEFGSKPER
jgi:serine/threonine protein kinase